MNPLNRSSIVSNSSSNSWNKSNVEPIGPVHGLVAVDGASSDQVDSPSSKCLSTCLSPWSRRLPLTTSSDVVAHGVVVSDAQWMLCGVAANSKRFTDFEMRHRHACRDRHGSCCVKVYNIVRASDAQVGHSPPSSMSDCGGGSAWLRSVRATCMGC